MACLFIIFSGGCSAVKYTVTIPKQPRVEYYSLANEKNHIVGNIDTTVVYINEQDFVANGDFGSKKVHLFVFMKFASNGIAYYSDYNDISFTQTTVLSKTGQYCRYRVINDELELEFYDHLAKHFKIWYGKIYSDKIQFYSYKLRVAGGAKGRLNFTFSKSTVQYTRPLIWPE